MEESWVSIFPYQVRLYRANVCPACADRCRRLCPMMPDGPTWSMQEQTNFCCTKIRLEDHAGQKVRGTRPHALMEGRPGLYRSVGHGEGLKQTAQLPVIVELPHVIVVYMDDPLRGIGGGYSVQSAYLGLYGTPRSTGAVPEAFPWKYSFNSNFRIYSSVSRKRSPTPAFR